MRNQREKTTENRERMKKEEKLTDTVQNRKRNERRSWKTERI